MQGRSPGAGARGNQSTAPRLATDTTTGWADRLAQLLLDARTGADVDPAQFPDLALDAGYDIQDAAAAISTAAGDPVVGYKIGLTTAAAQRSLGAAEPGWGRLYESGVVDGPARIELDSRPTSVEVELAVRTGPDGAIAAVAPAVEVVSSRWQQGPPAIGAWAADNGMSTWAVFGEWSEPGAEILSSCRAHATFDGRTLEGISQEATDNLAWLRRELRRRGRELEPNSLVLTGAVIGPVPVPPGGGTLRGQIEGLGEVSVELVAERPASFS